MQPSRVRVEVERPASGQNEQRKDPEPRETLRASPAGEDEDQRPDETIEEPGYGHGV